MRTIVYVSVIVISVALISVCALSNNYVALVVYEKDSVEYAFFRLNKFRSLSFNESDIDWALDNVRWNASLSLLVYGELWVLTKINSGLEDRLKETYRGNELAELILREGEQCYAEWYCNGNGICGDEK